MPARSKKTMEQVSILVSHIPDDQLMRPAADLRGLNPGHQPPDE
jgi:hypothetical protein